MALGDRARELPDRLGNLLGGNQSKGPDGIERRSGKRVPLPIPVHVQVGAEGAPQDARVHSVNQPGLSVEPGLAARPGDRIALTFDGIPGEVAGCTVWGIVVRADDGAAGIRIDRQGSDRDAVQAYRTLLLYYMRHKPLLENVNKGYVEGRCTSCAWIGRVGQKTPRCPRCGNVVEAL